MALVAAALHVAPGEGQGLAQTVRGAVRGVTAALQALPFSQAYRGAEEVLRGQAAVGWLRQLVLLAASALLFALVTLVHFGTADLANAASRRGPERLWSFGSPVAALAPVFQGLVLASREGRVALFLPLVVSACLARVPGPVRADPARANAGDAAHPGHEGRSRDRAAIGYWRVLPFLGARA